MTIPTKRVLTLVLTLALVLGSVHEAQSQVRRGREPEPAQGWTPPSIGIRGGWDQRANAEILGAQARIPVLRSGIVQLVPSADIAFLQGVKEYQYGAEVSWVPGGRRGGLFVTGGVAWRDSVFSADGSTDTRRTFFGYILGAGVKSQVGPLEFELGLRWIFLNDTGYRPSPATVGINYPFWDTGLPEGR